MVYLKQSSKGHPHQEEIRQTYPQDMTLLGRNMRLFSPTKEGEKGTSAVLTFLFTCVLVSLSSLSVTLEDSDSTSYSGCPFELGSCS